MLTRPVLPAPWYATASVVAAALVTAVLGVVAQGEGGIGARSPSGSLVVDVPSNEHPVWRLDLLAGHRTATAADSMELGIGARRRTLRRHVESVADRVSPFDWRAHGISFDIGCHPVDVHVCPLGVAIGSDDGGRIVMSPAVAFLTEEGIGVAVAHELAHLWQFSRHPQHLPGSIILELDLELPAGVDPAELEADCLVAAWGLELEGGATLGYWACPPTAVAAARAAWSASQRP
jgi:hypothetical protein